MGNFQLSVRIESILGLYFTSLMPSNSQPAPLRPRSRLRLMIFASALAAGLLFLAVQFNRSSGKSFLPVLDFVEYWAAGRLFMAGGNPYSWDAMLELEKSVGMKPDKFPPITGEETPLMMFNPPWTLVFIMPFAQSSFAASRVMWFVLGLGLVIFCADAIWRIYGGAPSPHPLPPGECPGAPGRGEGAGAPERRWLAWLVGVSFVPTLQVLQMGQIGPLMLLGLVGFLFCVYQSGWSAGIATVLIAIKPHLFGVFAVALFFWTVQQRRWSVFGGAAWTIGIIMGCLLAANPHLIDQYRHTMTVHSPGDCRTPILGSLLRVVFGLVFGRDQFWPQVIPQVVGLIWVAFYWYRRRNDWDWSEQLPLLVLVSLLTTPYGAWPFDLVVLLLPVIEIAARAQQASRAQLAIIVSVYAAIEVPALVLSVVGVDSFYFVWMPPALLVSYLGLRRMLTRQPVLRPSASLVQVS